MPTATRRAGRQRRGDRNSGAIGAGSLPDTSINELNRTIGELIAEVRGLRRDVQEDRRTSAEYRQGVREELANLVLRQTHIENDVQALKNRVDTHEEITVQVKTLRNKAEGAGTVGQWLLRTGIAIVGFAGWVLGLYTWLTGRPPP